MARFPSLRSLIDLIEGKANKRAPRDESPWGVSVSPLFEETLKRHLRIFPDLREKLKKFTEVKLVEPLSGRYGKHDRPFTGPLVGFWHAHLRDDAIVIYNLKNRNINLIAIVSHAEIEGKRMAKTVKKLAAYR